MEQKIIFVGQREKHFYFEVEMFLIANRNYSICKQKAFCLQIEN